MGAGVKTQAKNANTYNNLTPLSVIANLVQASFVRNLPQNPQSETDEITI
jgi:hypothetical protein